MEGNKTPSIIAVVVASICATALLLVCIFGGVYIKDLQGRVKEVALETDEPTTEGKFDVSKAFDCIGHNVLSAFHQMSETYPF